MLRKGEKSQSKGIMSMMGWMGTEGESEVQSIAVVLKITIIPKFFVFGIFLLFFQPVV